MHHLKTRRYLCGTLQLVMCDKGALRRRSTDGTTDRHDQAAPDGTPMTLRFQADVNLNQLILRATAVVSQPSIFTAKTAGLAGLPDPEVLAHAAVDGRVLVAHDLQTMPRHFAACIMTHQSAGLLLIPQHLPIAAVVDDLLLIWSTMKWKNGETSYGLSLCNDEFEYFDYTG